MTIFQYDDYKQFTLDLIAQMPRKGYGQFRKLAQVLNVNSVTITQIFKGDRDLSVEHAYELATHLGLSPLEAKYFLSLVQIQRAGTQNLKRHYTAELQELRQRSKQLKTRLPQDYSLNEEARSLFYSNWHYSAIRLASSIEGLNTIDTLTEYLGLPRASVRHAVDFLLSHGLMQTKNEKLGMGPHLTHLESTSPLITRHHTNWRLKALQHLEHRRPEDLNYTSPMALSNATKKLVREEIIKLIQDILRRVKEDPSECVSCLNIDWFDYSDR